MKPRWFATVGIAGTTIALAGILCTVPASASTSAAGTNRPSSAAAAARASLRGVVVGPSQPAKGRTTAQSDSFNWSGYADLKTSTNKKFAAVAGQWTQPAISCTTNEDQMAVFWVGLDGWTNDVVEQDGTLAQCYLGTAYYYTWWEMYPTNDIEVVGTISAGDTITSSVSYASGTFTLAVTDATHSAGTFSESETCGAGLTCKRSSAEWIAEAPGNIRGEYPLPDFVSWGLTNATVTGVSGTGAISTFSNIAIDMLDSSESYNLAAPGALNGSGNAFTDTWDDSY